MKTRLPTNGMVGIFGYDKKNLIDDFYAIVVGGNLEQFAI
jgi:hypothetical protein